MERDVRPVLYPLTRRVQLCHALLPIFGPLEVRVSGLLPTAGW
jgi:hypothetical protein